MKIELHRIKVSEVAAGYSDDAEKGCVGYSGRLDIRPPFQREFVYDKKQRDAVIETVKKNFPLNSMYWVRSADGSFEMLDGQQRTISICKYVHNEFTLDDQLSFANLTNFEREKILNYELMIYICEGNDLEKLDWFKTINITGESLTAQERRNAVFACEWLSDAKKFFSKSNCSAKTLYGKYLKGSSIRQEYLETVLKWISARDGMSIEQYMNEQKKNRVKNCADLKEYVAKIFGWVEKIFPYKPVMSGDMCGQNWGGFYEEFHEKIFDVQKISDEVQRLYEDEYVKNKRGIFQYVLKLFGNEEDSPELLQVRLFGNADKKTAYARQTAEAKKIGKSNCPECASSGGKDATKIWKLNEMEADHVTAWSKGGATTIDNCQMLCKHHNKLKGNS